MKDANILVVLYEIAVLDDVAAADIAPQPGTDVVVNMIAAECHPIAQADLRATGFPGMFEVIDVV